MTLALDRVPVDRITAEARQVRLGRLLLTLIAGLFWAIGWTVGKLALGVVWCAVAVKVGWQEARNGAPRRGVGSSPR